MIRAPLSVCGARLAARRSVSHLAVRVLLFATLAALSACGWAEWPPPGRIAPAAPPVRLVTPAQAPNAVVVQSGDSVFNLARRYNVSVRAIIEANDLRPPYVLRGGQRIVLPRAIEHEVKRGDTLYGISRQYGIDSFGIARLNGLEPPYLLRTGQRLQIPVTGADGERSQAAARPEAPGAGSAASSDRLAAVERAPLAPIESQEASPAMSQGAREPSAPSSDTPATAALSGAPPVPGRGPGDATAAAPTAIPPSAVSASGFSWPVRGKIASTFGAKARGLHNDGINVLAPRGAPVVAVSDGVVAYAGSELKGFGNLLLIKHNDGWVSAYGHNDELLVKPGERVRRGQVVARVGSTGNVTEPQLHFELRRGRKAVDPLEYLPRDA